MPDGRGFGGLQVGVRHARERRVCSMRAENAPSNRAGSLRGAASARRIRYVSTVSSMPIDVAQMDLAAADFAWEAEYVDLGHEIVPDFALDRVRGRNVDRFAMGVDVFELSLRY